MKYVATGLWLGLAIGWAIPAHAQSYPPRPVGPEIQDVPAYPPDQVYGPMTDEGVPVDPNGDYDPNARTPDVDVSADNGVAERYDDGYDPQAYAQFDNGLSPYGAWVDDPTYGRVWVPSSAVVGDDFTPYAGNGRWAMTEYGWTWVSDWDWGWAPFHFGRWAVMAGLGWGWVPGTVWGPAWVTWRVGGGSVGWAALPPRGTSIGRPIGARSPWRFTNGNNLAARQAYLTAAPVAFSRMTAVSNQRRLSTAGSGVLVNAGPTNLASGATERLASVAPNALPRAAIQVRPSSPVANRPWVQRRNGPLAPQVVRAPMVGFGRPRAGAGNLQPSRAAPVYGPRPTFSPGGGHPARR
jgi:hypothetical protein